jgi:Na+/melibiose symporter-like transporter
MGVMQGFGSNTLGSAIAPLVLVPIALAYGWREAFYVAAIPGLLSALLIWFLIKDTVVSAKSEIQERLSIKQAFAERNILLCAMIATLLVAYLLICWGFMPLYLTKMRGFDPDTMSWLMATLGISAGIGSFVVPAISDYVGRRVVMIIVPLIGVILPLGAMFFEGSTWMLAAIFFFGWALNGTFSLFMATIPSETVDPKRDIGRRDRTIGCWQDRRPYQPERAHVDYAGASHRRRTARAWPEGNRSAYRRPFRDLTPFHLMKGSEFIVSVAYNLPSVRYNVTRLKSDQFRT